MIFNSYGGDEIKIGDEEYLLLRESDILATFSNASFKSGVRSPASKT